MVDVGYRQDSSYPGFVQPYGSGNEKEMAMGADGSTERLVELGAILVMGFATAHAPELLSYHWGTTYHLCGRRPSSSSIWENLTIPIAAIFLSGHSELTPAALVIS